MQSTLMSSLVVNNVIEKVFKRIEAQEYFKELICNNEAFHVVDSTLAIMEYAITRFGFSHDNGEAPNAVHDENEVCYHEWGFDEEPTPAKYDGCLALHAPVTKRAIIESMSVALTKFCSETAHIPEII